MNVFAPSNAQLFTLRESPPAHPKTATFAKSTGYRELSVCALCLSTGGRRERRLRRRARRRRRQDSISRLLRSFAQGTYCKPPGAIVWPSWGHFGSLLGLSWGALGTLLGALGAVLGLFGAPLRPSRSHLEASEGHRKRKG